MFMQSVALPLRSNHNSHVYMLRVLSYIRATHMNAVTPRNPQVPAGALNVLTNTLGIVNVRPICGTTSGNFNSNDNAHRMPVQY